jgi:hypothetical protein
VSRYLDGPQAQSGSHVAPPPGPRRRTAGVVWGTRGPEFKSRRPDGTEAPLRRGFRRPSRHSRPPLPDTIRTRTRPKRPWRGQSSRATGGSTRSRASRPPRRASDPRSRNADAPSAFGSCSARRCAGRGIRRPAGRAWGGPGGGRRPDRRCASPRRLAASARGTAGPPLYPPGPRRTCCAVACRSRLAIVPTTGRRAWRASLAVHSQGVSRARRTYRSRRGLCRQL